MKKTRKDLLRVGVFYDGNYFLHVSNYYNYFHSRKKRLNIGGLHEFIRNIVAQEEDVDPQFCQVIEAHFFRGRISAQEANQRGNQLYNDRVFDDILMSEGVVTHYLPIRPRGGRREDKGIDVWLALEAFEQTFYKRFNVLVLITSDGDYVPLIRKINSLGTKVMVLSWDFDYTDDQGREVTTRTSQELIREVTYPIAMHELINDGLKKKDRLVENLFSLQDFSQPRVATQPDDAVGEVKHARIISLNNGYGFIQYPPNNLFFHYMDITDGDFDDFVEGDMVEFTIGQNDKGQEVAKNVRKLVDYDVNSW
ncbi:MAG: NYN domain-containing protein [Bacteroidales bacterium]|nr:NYN domain-containing protein [Bacteroidales bacterium]HPD95767.1 NYN domain-containing protein [Tenuifilaceae bacterium]HRX31097.1 NYN domain-containing protein [Tenuifilaceae bacterium]